MEHFHSFKKNRQEKRAVRDFTRMGLADHTKKTYKEPKSITEKLEEVAKDLSRSTDGKTAWKNRQAERQKAVEDFAS